MDLNGLKEHFTAIEAANDQHEAFIRDWLVNGQTMELVRVVLKSNAVMLSDEAPMDLRMAMSLAHIGLTKMVRQHLEEQQTTNDSP